MFYHFSTVNNRSWDKYLRTTTPPHHVSIICYYNLMLQSIYTQIITDSSRIVAIRRGRWFVWGGGGYTETTYSVSHPDPFFPIILYIDVQNIDSSTSSLD